MTTIPVTQSQLSIKESARRTRPEIELLLCCARTHIDPTTEERIEVLLQQDIDWTYLIQTSARHRVMPLLYRSLNATCPESVPDPLLAQLRNHFHTNAVHNLFLTQALLKLLHLFKDSDILAIPFKGVVLATLAYGNLALRQLGDLDILVHKQDITKAKELLLSQGYELDYDLDWEHTFTHPDSRIQVDIHQAITPSEFPVPFDFASLWKSSQPVSLSGNTILGLSPEYSLLVLCVNLAKDCWQKRERLAQICDIAELLRVYPEMDWENLLQEANRLGCKRIFLLGLLLASDLLGAAIPEQVSEKIQAEPMVKILAAQVYEWIFCEVGSLSRGFQRESFHFRVREHLQDTIPYLIHLASHRFNLLIAPSQKDQSFLLLPKTLSFLYYFIRPIRVVVDRLNIPNLDR